MSLTKIRAAYVLGLLLLHGAAFAQASEEAPTTWVDKETGHRVWRLTKEAGSTALYFNYKRLQPGWQVDGVLRARRRSCPQSRYF